MNIKSQADCGIHWFRRDLRVRNNFALHDNLHRCGGRVLGLFCFDSRFLSRADFSHRRFAFFLKTIRALKSEMQSLGGDLLVVPDAPQQAFAKWLEFSSLPTVSWNRDYEPFACQRDQMMTEFFRAKGVEIITGRDHLLFEPWEILKPGKEPEPYRVFSPFARRWMQQLDSSTGAERLHPIQLDGSDLGSDLNRTTSNESLTFKLKWSEFQNREGFPFRDVLDEFEARNAKYVSIPIPKAGSGEALKQLGEFRNRIATYASERDFPAKNAGSGLSRFIKNGSLTVPEILKSVLPLRGAGPEVASVEKFIQELIWREFYYSILYHWPHVENRSFINEFSDFPWENNEQKMSRWCEGTTGVPIVDAGMRELRETGLMHNRVRMIVASFLTKDLRIDWRWGEKFFMNQLLDGDLAANNGGWQWSASTGCDPQPYFRIFNPWLQGRRFDLLAEYIKTYVPELRTAASAAIHDPKADRSPWGYPEPIVDHAVEKRKTLQIFQSLKRPSLIV